LCRFVPTGPPPEDEDGAEPGTLARGIELATDPRTEFEVRLGEMTKSD
jgi:hypothetical protein